MRLPAKCLRRCFRQWVLARTPPGGQDAPRRGEPSPQAASPVDSVGLRPRGSERAAGLMTSRGDRALAFIRTLDFSNEDPSNYLAPSWGDQTPLKIQGSFRTIQVTVQDCDSLDMFTLGQWFSVFLMP